RNVLFAMGRPSVETGGTALDGPVILAGRFLDGAAIVRLLAVALDRAARRSGEVVRAPARQNAAVDDGRAEQAADDGADRAGNETTEDAAAECAEALLQCLLRLDGPVRAHFRKA